VEKILILNISMYLFKNLIHQKTSHFGQVKNKLHVVDGISEMRYELKYLICVIPREINTVAYMECGQFF
jgi:hypothetical protein